MADTGAPALRPARTYLYVPGDQPRLFGKAAVSGADAVILDLEDAVAPDRKAAGHAAVDSHERTVDCQWWIRLDPAWLDIGVATAARPGTTGVVVPTAEPELLHRVDRALTETEQAKDLAPLAVIALLETARGVAEVRSVAGAPRVHRLGIGEADLAAELNMSPSTDRSELWPVRSDVVIASAVAGLVPPVGPVHTDIDDVEMLARSTEQLVRQGFSARTLLHPRQVDVVHRALAPTAEELQDAEDVLAAFDSALAAGSGVARDRHGRFVDLAVVRSARAVTARTQP